MKLTAPLRQEDAQAILSLLHFHRHACRIPGEGPHCSECMAALERAIAGKRPTEPTPAERLSELERCGQRVLPETTVWHGSTPETNVVFQADASAEQSSHVGDLVHLPRKETDVSR